MSAKSSRADKVNKTILGQASLPNSHKMKLLSAVAALAGAVAAVPAPSLSNDKGLEVSLELVGHSDVKAIVKNSGSEQLRLLKTASIIGDAPSKKVQVTGAG